MNCPKCNKATKVIDSEKEIDSIERVRKCVWCGHKFDTVEIDKDLYCKLAHKDTKGELKKHH